MSDPCAVLKKSMSGPDAACYTSLGLKSGSTTTKRARMAAHCCVIVEETPPAACPKYRQKFHLSKLSVVSRGAGLKLQQHNLPCIKAEVKLTCLCTGLREREPRWHPLGRVPALSSANVALEQNHHLCETSLPSAADPLRLHALVISLPGERDSTSDFPLKKTPRKM